MGKQFSDKLLSNLKPQATKFYSREGRGFALRVMPSGIKTFLFIYTTHEGKRREMNLGNYPHVKLAEAREQYQAAYSLAAKGIDPQEHKKAITEAKAKESNSSFGKLAELYLAKIETKFAANWVKTISGALKCDLLPVWKDKHIGEIRRKDIIDLLEKVGNRAKGQIKNVQKAAGGVFRYAVDREYIEINPTSNLSKALSEFQTGPRERSLSESEIKVIWDAIDAGVGSEETKRALKLILVTAQRPGEVASMHRSEIDGEWWTIPKEKVKTRKEHLVYLTPTALKLIGDSDGHIFPSPRMAKPIQTSHMSQLVSISRVDTQGNVYHTPYYGLPRWTPHDLRRTARTHMARIKIIEEHCEAVLNHAKRGISGVYNRYAYQEEKKLALIKWEAELLELIK